MVLLSNENGGRDWGRIVRMTLLGTGACLAVAFALSYFLLFFDGLTPFGRSLLTATILPLALGLPLCLAVAFLADRVRLLRRELTRTATYDRLTGSYNGTVFASTVERRIRSTGTPRSGAFLIVEADHLRGIRRRYGHAWGDEALRVIAGAIRGAVRAGDLVGRLGVDEFGVFLPDATEDDARAIGERIRSAVDQVYYAPEGTRDTLQVRIGGVYCEREMDFEAMFRLAAQEIENARDPETKGFALAALPGRA